MLLGEVAFFKFTLMMARQRICSKLAVYFLFCFLSPAKLSRTRWLLIGPGRKKMIWKIEDDGKQREFSGLGVGGFS